jgi:hypothetical protein
MIPFVTTGTDLFHRPCFSFPAKSFSLSFENNSKGQSSHVAILGFLAYKKQSDPIGFLL